MQPFLTILLYNLFMEKSSLAEAEGDELQVLRTKE